MAAIPSVCGDANATIQELLNAIIVQTAGGEVGLAVILVADADPTYLAECGDVNKEPVDVLRRSITLGANGKPRLVLVTE